MIAASDGTTLRAGRRGSGEPLVLIHGTIGSASDWAHVLPRLATRFSVTAYDRRGRGGSGDGASYAIEQEVDDVRAVVAGAGGPVHLVGHSFGAVLALLFAARHPRLVRTLAVYEPPIAAPATTAGGVLGDLDAAVASGSLDEAVATFLRAAGATDDEIRLSRADDGAWRSMRAAVPTVAREVRAAMGVLPLGPSVLAAIVAPTLVLLGADQQAATFGGVEELARQLPHGELAHVPGRHLALFDAPEAFAATIRDFIDRASSGS